jgi:2-(1,2-epoxy-1,2-dihydrophenyl)acetyl-CoA isomerase
MPKPVVAAVDGVAAGAGACLALACDIRVGSEEAAFAQSFVRIGLVPDWGGMFSLVRLVGAGRAADLMMTGDRIPSQEAHAIGLLQRVFPTPTFEADSRAYAARLASAPPHALALIKQGLRLSDADTLEQVFTLERKAQLELFSEADCLEGLRAFFEKRRPAFRGSALR